MAQRYPTFESIACAFTPQIESLLLSNPEKAYSEKSPTLYAVSELYGFDAAALWVKTQLLGIDFISGAKRDADEAAIAEISRLIAHKYRGTKLSEFILFVARFKLGQYGKFYGAFDSIAVGEAFKKFLKEREIEFGRIEANRLRDAIEARRYKPEQFGGLSSLEAYREMQRRAQAGDVEAIESLKPPKRVDT